MGIPTSSPRPGTALVDGETGAGPDPDPAPSHILVVDDNPDTLALLVALLQTRTYRVATASTGHAALAAVGAVPPDLILLDVMLPDIDGHEVARRLKTDPTLPFIPIILVTAKNELRDKIYGLEQGADDFLSKPVNHAELIARVRALLRLKRAQDDLRRQHETLRTLHSQLRDSEATRAHLVQMITHDLRGPLTGLLGALELIEDGSLGPLTREQHQFVTQALQNCGILNDMVTDLLDVYRLEAGHTELNREPVDLHELADLACVQVQGAVAEKRLTLTNCIAAALPPAWADRNLLLRVLANLLNNAFKYTERGDITLQALLAADNGYEHAVADEGQPAQTGQTYLIVQVQDTGVGIPAEERAHVFEKFYRVRPRTPGSRVRGAGLGLYFCKHVVAAHGGNIWVEGRPDGQSGSVFTFSVPASVPR